MIFQKYDRACEATWHNGKRTIKGRWWYTWSSDTFTIELDSRDRITGQNRKLFVKGDKPEWGNWKRKQKLEGRG